MINSGHDRHFAQYQPYISCTVRVALYMYLDIVVHKLPSNTYSASINILTHTLNKW